MKVCHVGTAHRRYDIRIFYKECTSLAKAGYDVTFLIADDGLSEERKNGVRILPVQGVPRARFLKRFFKYNAVMFKKALELDADIYHLHEWDLWPWSKELKKRNKIVVFDCHEYYVDDIRASQKKMINRNLILRLYLYCESYMSKYSDALIFPCTKDGVHPFEGKSRKVITLDNLPTLDLYNSYVSETNKYENSICYIGSLSEERGVTEVIKAASITKATAYIAGKFASPEYKLQINTLPEKESMKYMGVLEKDKVIELLQKCQIGMATLHSIGQFNQFDNLPTKCFEYMSLGLPVILTKAKYNEQLNNKYHFGICVDAENEKEIAEKICYLLDNPDIAYEMGQNGRRAVLTEFNWEREQEKLLALYEELTALNS